MDSSEFPVPPETRLIFVGFTVAVGPLATTGETVAVRFRDPVKPPRLERVRLVVTEEPRDRMIEVEFVVSAKSGGGMGSIVKKACVE